MSGMLPGLNLANVVAQLIVSPYYNSNVRFFLAAEFSAALSIDFDQAVAHRAQEPLHDFLARLAP
jgi:hypothetical protein